MFLFFYVIFCYDEITHHDHNDLADHEVTGIYPGEGHEAMHAQHTGNIGEGKSFHEHEQRYGAMHEINGEFNDGHSRLEHQEMYKNNGGLNEHANMGGAGSAGINDMHYNVIGAAASGHAGGLDEHGASNTGGWGNDLRREAHGFGGFAHGDGDYGSYSGYDGLNQGWGAYYGWNNAGANHGWNDGAWGNHNGWGGDMLHAGLNAAKFVDHNQAVLADYGLLTPMKGGLHVGGSSISTMGGIDHGHARFFNSPEHALYHNLRGQNTPANIVDFYEGAGVLDPVTGQFVGGYMHPSAFSDSARKKHKALEIERNIANGNGFRKALLDGNLFERMHGHYGKGSIPFEGSYSQNVFDAAAGGKVAEFAGVESSNKHQQKMLNNMQARQDALNNVFYTIKEHGKTLPISNFDAKRLEAVLHFQAAQLNIEQGNMGRAIEHMKLGKIAGMEAKTMAIDSQATKGFMNAEYAAKTGDFVTANANKAAATCMYEAAHMSAEAYANSVGISNHHVEDSVLFGGEQHAAIARAKALEAEKLRMESQEAMAAGDVNTANAMTAASAVASATGRAENEFGKMLNQITQKQKENAQMDFFENVQDQGVKEAIAHQDNMHKITTGNDAEFNKSIKETLSDMNLKHIAGAHNKAHKELNKILEEIPADKFVDGINTANVVQKHLKPPPIHQALVIANADEIAESMIEDEERRLKRAKEKKDKEDAEKDLILKRLATKPIETLGIIGSIPEDADTIKLENASLKLPFRGYEPMVAKNENEREALEAQNRLRDDLRGKITRMKFDSHLNTIKAGEGWLNLPESAEKIEIESGLAYFNSEAKAKMEHDGFPTDSLSHVINTGERTDMAAGMDYYVADIGGFTIDLPTSHNPHPIAVAYNKGKIISLAESQNIQIEKGSISIVPWKTFKKNIRPKVNQGIVIYKPNKKIKQQQDKIEKLQQEAEEIVKKDEKMLQNIARTRKKIIINPDGTSFIEMKPPYGVTELVRVEDARNIIPSKYITEGRALEYGQNGVSEVKGETEDREGQHESVIQNVELKELKSESDMEKLGLASAISDKETSFVISKDNAFNKKIKGTKQLLLKKAAAGKSQEEIQVIAEEGRITLAVNQGTKKTAFEQMQHNKKKEKENEEKMVTVQDAEMEGTFAYESALKEFKSHMKSISKMSDTELIKTIEEYTHKSIEEMHEFDFMFSTYDFYASRKVLLDKIKKFGFDYIEWRNTIKKYLKTNIVLKKRLGFDSHILYNLMNKITDEELNNLKAYYTLPFDSSESVKKSVYENYQKAVNELHALFGSKNPIVLDFIKKEIGNIEHSESTEGGTVDYNLKKIKIPVERIEEYTDYIDSQGRKVTQKKNHEIASEITGNFIKNVYTDNMGEQHQVCVLATNENNQPITNPPRQIIYYNNINHRQGASQDKSECVKSCLKQACNCQNTIVPANKNCMK